MKRIKVIFPLLALLALACGCRKSGLTEEEMEQGADRMEAERFAVMEILHNLADVRFPSDFEGDIDIEGATYEPTIGSVRDASQPMTRSVRVDSASDSEDYFRSLVFDDTFIRTTSDGCIIDLTGLDIREDGRKQDFGTLTFHRGGDGSNVGYAEVSIPCIPHLERIDYKTKEQWGDNGYESPCILGDIYLGKGVYWVCVDESESSDEKGVLINLEPGYGTLHHLLWDANYEADNDCFPKLSDIKAYLRLCAADWYASKKRRIINNPKYTDKIFPRLCDSDSRKKFDWNYREENSGFATLEEDYSFWDASNGHDFAAIVYDTNKEGGKKYWVTGSKKRYMYYLKVPCQTIRDEGTTGEKYGSRSDDDFYEFYNEHWMYICNAVYFTTQIPSGFTLENI